LQLQVRADAGRPEHELDREIAETWVRRGDRQQERHIADREQRFFALGDVVEHVRPHRILSDPRSRVRSRFAVDPAEHPRSRRADRRVDVDPFLLALARATRPDQRSVDYAYLELSAPGWVDALGIERK
jgi:hypothetical protein